MPRTSARMPNGDFHILVARKANPVSGNLVGKYNPLSLAQRAQIIASSHVGGILGKQIQIAIKAIPLQHRHIAVLFGVIEQDRIALLLNFPP